MRLQIIRHALQTGDGVNVKNFDLGGNAQGGGGVIQNRAHAALHQFIGDGLGGGGGHRNNG